MPGSPEMSAEQIELHLSQISTAWTTLLNAHAAEGAEAREMWGRLLERYRTAVYRYLLASVRRPDEADELFQEFALRLVRGDFKRASPQRGRFRQFLKTSLYHLVVDHRRKQQRQPEVMASDTPEPIAEPEPEAEADRQFLVIWRAELMSRAWESLARFERESGQPLNTVLRFRTDHPEIRSPEAAAHLAAQLGKEVTADWVRKRLFLARDKFTEYLLEEVERSLDRPSTEALEEELLDLELLEHCRSALQRRRGGV